MISPVGPVGGGLDSPVLVLVLVEGGSVGLEVGISFSYLGGMGGLRGGGERAWFREGGIFIFIFFIFGGVEKGGMGRGWNGEKGGGSFNDLA